MTPRAAHTILLVSGLLWSSTALAGSPLSVQVRPSTVSIGLLYGGKQVQLRATAPKGCDLAFLVTGKTEDLHLNKKGKKGGILWMNVGDVRYKKVPSVYIVRSSRPLGEIATPEELTKLRLGYPALTRRIAAPQGAEASKFFGELIKLKELHGEFSASEHGVTLKSGTADTLTATASFHLSASAAPGKYKVTAYCFRDRKVVARSGATLELKLSRHVAFLSGLARKHGLLYGILAALIAIIAGLITGFVFGRRGDGAH